MGLPWAWQAASTPSQPSARRQPPTATSTCIGRRLASPVANGPAGRGSGAPRGWSWAVQLVAGAVVVGLVGRALLRNWSQFRSLHFEVALRPGWIALSVLLVFAPYALQVQSWRQILAGWSQHLSYPRALKIWLLVNLGRYVPAKVWSVPGPLVLPHPAGVHPSAPPPPALPLQPPPAR